ncbi:hypothetical protein [Rhodococcus sp. 27YEA15]|uniref:hypothetical protein n=1 Tax=Rhodococcus sp. 27YEA15 TaxID=3156259 RepID=UPI003C7BB918
MSTQIAVRLPDEMVVFLDGEVAAGRASSRADLVARALERERRRLVAERDAEILSGDRRRDELDSLASHIAAQERN